jgi:serine/threonine protein kinase
MSRHGAFSMRDVMPGTPECAACRAWHWPADKHVAEYGSGEFVTVEDTTIRVTRALGRGGQGAVLAGVTVPGNEPVVVKTTVSDVATLRDEVDVYRTLQLTPAHAHVHREFMQRHGGGTLPLPLLFGYVEARSPKLSAVASFTLAGPSLHDVLAGMQRSGRTFSGDNIRHVLSRVLVALEYLAERHHVHVDIKPENICIGPPGHTGDIMLIDFGVSEETKFDPSEWAQVGAMSGTRTWASIAQHLGWGASFVSDLEALFYTMIDCVGKLPFHEFNAASSEAALVVRQKFIPWSRIGAAPSLEAARVAAAGLVELAGVTRDMSAYAPLVQFGTFVLGQADHGVATIGVPVDDDNNLHFWRQIDAIKKHEDAYVAGQGEAPTVHDFYALARASFGSVEYPVFDTRGELSHAVDGVYNWLRAHPQDTSMFALQMAAIGQYWDDVERIVQAGTRPPLHVLMHLMNEASDNVWQLCVPDGIVGRAWSGVRTERAFRRMLQIPGSTDDPQLYLFVAFNNPQLLPTMRRQWPRLPIAEYMRVNDRGDYEDVGAWMKEGSFAGEWGMPYINRMIAIGRILQEYNIPIGTVTTPDSEKFLILLDSRDFVQKSPLREEFMRYARQLPRWAEAVDEYADKYINVPEEYKVEMKTRAMVM